MTNQAHGNSIVGWRVSRCCIGFRVEVEMTSGVNRDAARGVVLISGRAIVVARNVTHEIEVDGAKIDIAPLLDIVGANITSSSVRADGALMILLDNNLSLTVPPHPDFESWELRTPNEQLVCQPGGVISVW